VSLGEAEVLAGIAMRRTLGEGDASILILILPQSSRRGPGHRKVIASAETVEATETEAVIMGQGPGHGSIHPADPHAPPVRRRCQLKQFMSVHIRQPGSCKPCADPGAPVAILLLLEANTEVSLLAAAQQQQEHQQCSQHLSSYQAAKGFPLLIPLAMAA